jgi:hypothetical protein
MAQLTAHLCRLPVATGELQLHLLQQLLSLSCVEFWCVELCAEWLACGPTGLGEILAVFSGGAGAMVVLPVIPWGTQVRSDQSGV